MNKGEGRVRRREGRTLRRERWESLFSPATLAAAGAAISLAYFFQRSLEVRAVMFLFFVGAAWLSGKKLSLVATIVVSAGIVAANLLLRVGKVIAVLGPLKITETALLDGLGKALVFEGLMYISKASILPGLRLPGRFGSLVATAFVYYDRIVEYKGSIKPATLIADADRLMLKIWDEPLSETARKACRSHGPAAVVALVAAVLAAYVPLIIRG
jgi:hypothetical protein